MICEVSHDNEDMRRSKILWVSSVIRRGDLVLVCIWSGEAIDIEEYKNSKFIIRKPCSFFKRNSKNRARKISKCYIRKQVSYKKHHLYRQCLFIFLIILFDIQYIIIDTRRCMHIFCQHIQWIFIKHLFSWSHIFDFWLNLSL